MERNIVVERATHTPIEKRPVEVVERKGLGHPDSLIDGIMEEISKELSKAYLNEFGKILHHNVDKGQICGGGTDVKFGGGVFTKPIYILLSGRATESAEGKSFPVHHIAQETTHKYLNKIVPELNLDDVEVESKIAPGSSDLVDLFLRGPKIPYANDTSFGVGYAPFSDLETVVFATEQALNSQDYKSKHPEVGSDIKVMGVRDGDKLRITVACAFVSKYISDISQYVEFRTRLKEDIEKIAKKHTSKEVSIFVNTADDIENESVYITLTGTSAEMGDDGSVGRGNRPNGLITPFRPMTLEAACGKNPVNHVGKIYSVLAIEAAQKIAKDYTVEEVNVVLLSQIGKPIDQPKIATVSLISEDYSRIARDIQSDLDAMLSDVTEVTNKIVEGKVSLF